MELNVVACDMERIISLEVDGRTHTYSSFSTKGLLQ